MLRHKTREAMRLGAGNRPREAGRPAVLVAPVPAQGGRWAKPGERPPSKFAAGENDNVIESFDAYAKAWRANHIKRHG